MFEIQSEMSFCRISTPSLWLVFAGVSWAVRRQRHFGHTIFAWLGQMKALHLWHCCCIFLSSFELQNKHHFLLQVPLVLVTWSGGGDHAVSDWPPDPACLCFFPVLSCLPCSCFRCFWWPSLLCGTGSFQVYFCDTFNLMLWMKAVRPSFVERGWFWNLMVQT